MNKKETNSESLNIDLEQKINDALNNNKLENMELFSKLNDINNFSKNDKLSDNQLSDNQLLNDKLLNDQLLDDKLLDNKLLDNKLLDDKLLNDNKDISINEIKKNITDILQLEIKSKDMINKDNNLIDDIVVTSRNALIGSIIFFILSSPFIYDLFDKFLPKLGRSNTGYSCILFKSLIFMILFSIMIKTSNKIFYNKKCKN